MKKNKKIIFIARSNSVVNIFDLKWKIPKQQNNTRLTLVIKVPKTKLIGKKPKTRLINKTEHIDWEDNYRLFQLLENIDYLETAYNQIQELADNLELDVAAKFLSYPIPAAIVEEWERVKWCGSIFIQL